MTYLDNSGKRRGMGQLAHLPPLTPLLPRCRITVLPGSCRIFAPHWRFEGHKRRDRSIPGKYLLSM